jgi:hypothetical protein
MSQEELTQVITIVILVACLISSWWIISSVVSLVTKLFYRVMDYGNNYSNINIKSDSFSDISISSINGNVTIKGNVNSVTINGNKII